MIGNKAVLTYKRKRFSSRPGLGFENDCPDQSHGCQTLEALKTPVTEEDPKHVSETKDSEHIKATKPFSNCIKRQDHMCSLQDQASNNRKENAFSGESDTTQIPYDPHTMVLHSCGRNSLQSTVENSVPIGVSSKDKLGFPLITFSRRLRHKKTVDGTGIQDRSTVKEKYDFMAAKGFDSMENNGGLLDLSMDFTGNDPIRRYCPKTNEDVDLNDVDTLSVPEIEKSDTLTGEVLKDTPSIIEPESDTQPEAPECHVSAVDESQIISSDGLESAKIRADKVRDGGSLASFNLSKLPPGDLMGCNLTLESSSNAQPDTNVSETHRYSTESTSGSHSVVLHEFLDERIGETSLSQVPSRLSSSTNMSGVDLPSVSMAQNQTSNRNFLQLFPEDRATDTLPLKTALQETPFIHPEDRRSIPSSNRKNLHFRSSNNSTAFFSLSPPTEARNNFGPSLSSWPNFNLKTRDLIQDTPGAQYPSDSASLMRHKILLDNIISKARAVSGKRGGFSDHFEPPTMWSEEELDFLWIGVRRHGIGNWDAMLQDARLHFAAWKSPRELAERWAEEQSGLLSTEPPSRKKPKKYNFDLIEGPQLSLGLSGCRANGPTLNPNSYESRGRSMFDPLLTNGPTNGNLPHWLREPVSLPPSAVSYTGHSGMMQWINQPFSGPNRTTGMGNVPSGLAHFTESQLDRVDSAIDCSKPDEVIVINSDVSSEETISDDHSVRQ